MTCGTGCKLTLSYLALVLAVVAAIYGYLSKNLANQGVESERSNLLAQARLAVSIAEQQIANVRRDAPRMAELINRRCHADVAIITLNGELAGASETGAKTTHTENEADAPEFVGVIKTGIGSSIRYSATLRKQMMFVALPFKSRSGESAVLRLALPLSHVDTTLSFVASAAGWAIALGVVCSLLLGYVLSNITARALKTIAAAATRFAKGDLQYRIVVNSKDEAAKVATIINDMAARIDSQLTRISGERNRLDTVLSSMGEGVMVADKNGMVTMANASFRSLFSLGEYVEGESLIELTRQPVLHNTLKKAFVTGEEIVEEIIVEGFSEKAILTHWVPLMENNTMTGVLAVFHDISDLKKLEKIRKDFVANVSHELRTPVAVIKGYAEALVTDGKKIDPAQVEHFARIIHNHADRLSSLISDLLTISQLESGKLELNMQPVRLWSAVNRACNLLESRARDREINIQQRGVEQADPVLADLGRLEQVLINLLDNAIKYTPPHGAITISTLDEGSMLKISVADTGIGIPPKDLPRIFERFYRVDAARSREMGGTGLGLSIVKHIVQAHGGTLSVDSIPGKGSTFSFTIPKA